MALYMFMVGGILAVNKRYMPQKVGSDPAFSGKQRSDWPLTLKEPMSKSFVSNAGVSSPIKCTLELCLCAFLMSLMTNLCTRHN